MNLVAGPARDRRASGSRAHLLLVLSSPAPHRDPLQATPACWAPRRQGRMLSVSNHKVTAPAVCCSRSGCSTSSVRSSFGQPRLGQLLLLMPCSYHPLCLPGVPGQQWWERLWRLAWFGLVGFFNFLIFLLKPDQIPDRVQVLAQTRRQCAMVLAEGGNALSVYCQ